jgi:hypothetical protein
MASTAKRSSAKAEYSTTGGPFAAPRRREGHAIEVGEVVIGHEHIRLIAPARRLSFRTGCHGRVHGHVRFGREQGGDAGPHGRMVVDDHQIHHIGHDDRNRPGWQWGMTLIRRDVTYGSTSPRRIA